MITAGLKKESLFYCRRRLIVVLIILFFMALINPVLYKALGETITAAKAQGVNIAQAETLWDSVGGSLPVSAVVSSFTTIYSFGLIVFFLTIMPMAGGERNSRAEIIPRLAGLSHEGFVIPKFLFYVILSFIISSAACYLSVTAAGVMADSEVTGFSVTREQAGDGSSDGGGSVSGLLPVEEREQLRITAQAGGTAPAQADVPVPNAASAVSFNKTGGLYASALIGLFFAFCTSLYLFAGLTTGRPGLSIILTLIGVEAISFVLEKISAGGYNPTALAEIGTALLISGNGSDASGMYGNIFAQTVRDSLTPANIAASVFSSLILIVVFMLLTIVLRRVHEVDNTADIG